MKLDNRKDSLQVHSVPKLSDGFIIRLHKNEWAALFPLHHLMWVSPDINKVRDFVKNGLTSYEIFLSESMKESFTKYYTDPAESPSETNPILKGVFLDPTICILPTNDCSLGCTYCFAGTTPKKFGAISWEVAKAALDLAIRNAVLNRLVTSSGKLELRFFGGGEPTNYWNMFTRIVEYARERAIANDVKVFVATITNGQIEEERYEWFRNNIDEVSISMDGPPDIQNEQRPTFDGRNSFDVSWKFLSAMDALKVKIKSIRITVTADTVNRMKEIAEFFWNNLSRVYPLQFEPVYLSEVGRRNAVMPRPKDFVAQFRLVEKFALCRNAVVGSATKPLVIRKGAYCDSLEGKGLFVTPDGFLSLCSEISVPSDPRKDKYFVGQYNLVSQRFQIFNDGTSKTRTGIPERCRNCFALYSCRGGCEPRSLNVDVVVRKAWCAIVRENIRWTWSDVRSDEIHARARFGDPNGEELIWLPIWEKVKSMDG